MKLEILFFYDRYNRESVLTKSVLSKQFEKRKKDIDLKLNNIDITKNITLCKKYKVSGVPTTLIIKDKEPILRHLGQLSEEEINIILNEL